VNPPLSTLFSNVIAKRVTNTNALSANSFYGDRATRLRLSAPDQGRHAKATGYRRLA
jgi:hypothetical protein